MTILPNYKEFAGIHWETGTIRNALAYQGAKAPHTNEAPTEALFFGISGGIAMGYFVFAYEGYDPMAKVLTRNTFDPFPRILDRMAIPREVIRSNNADKAVSNLVDTLENGTPVIALADHFTLSYNALPADDEGMWGMLPIVVYGYDEANDEVYIADRASVPLTVTTSTLHTARARVKKDKFQIMTLDTPNWDKLSAAVQMGIWDCIRLYTEEPPRGPKSNFGFDGFHKWIKALKSKSKTSWVQQFPPGREMLAGLSSAYSDIRLYGKDSFAERSLFADFLREAAVILDKSELNDVADQFDTCGAAWEQLTLVLLPDDVPMLREMRECMLAGHQALLHGDIEAKHANMQTEKDLLAQAETDFPLNEAQAADLRSNIAEQLQTIHDLELDAITHLQAVMG